MNLYTLEINNLESMKYKYFLALCLFLLSQSAKAQEEKEKEIFFQKKELKDDIEQLQEKLLAIHPGLDYFVPKSTIEQMFVDRLENLPDSMSRMDFFDLMEPIIDTIECGHTNIKFAHKLYERKKEGDKPLLFPIKVLLLDNEVLLKEDFNIGSSIIPKGSQILSIDSVGIDHIVDRMTKYHRGADGDNHYPERLWAVRTFTDGYARFFGLKDKFLINLINSKTKKNETYTIDAIPPNALREINKEENKSYSPVTFKTVDNGKIGVITMTSFSNKGFFEKSKKKINKAFKEVRTKNLDKLILDIRNNGGGAISNIEHLTRQLIDEKYLIIKESSFKKAYLDIKKSFFQKIFLGLARKEIKGENVYFRKWDKKKIKPKNKTYTGDLIVLINGQSYSAAAMTPALLKDHKRGTLIGEEAGGSYHLAFAGVSKYVTMKNSKLKIRIPVISLIYDVEESSQDRRDGVIPDIVKKYTKEDLINGTDTVLEYAIEYLNNQKT